MMKTLDQLSAQEEKLYKLAEGLEGSMEATEQYLEEAGVFDAYASLHKKYLNFFERVTSSQLLDRPEVGNQAF
ncbi:hypothetical protein FY528_14605 [Hymenobacter lutimineralis]|uniref:Uncharacterized protein n=1 Tax=Hymenobacter lutimineralis TaxID=2606448 RepID=A0A5D6UV32_9BACT|nr:hypothetical protein [Hymenobacter lutimineralis]TYZ07591.1 hypothetical protein FY528_14605 [Hymenobacter lutimineralis]